MLLAVFPPSEVIIALQPKDPSECINFSLQVGYKSSQVIDFAKKLLHVLLAGRSFYLLDSFYLLWVNLYAVLMNNEAQELPSRYTKDTLQWIHFESVLSYPLER